MKRRINGREEKMEKGKLRDYLQISLSNNYKQLLASFHENKYMIIRFTKPKRKTLFQTFMHIFW